jgi:hypothetical protein
MDDTKTQIEKLRKDLNDLTDEVYNGNFTSQQDFKKDVRFSARVKLPNLTTLPSTCSVGEITVSGGKAYVCSATNVWTVIGSQTA